MNVYIFDFGSQIKVGQSINIKRRLRTIETQSGREAVQIFSIEADGKYENLLHKILSEYRGIGEYFNFPFEYAVSILKSLVQFSFVKEVKKDSQLLLPLLPLPVKENINPMIFDTLNMKGYTIQELSTKLKISERAVYQRLHTLGIEPLTRQAVYPESSLKAIEVVSKGGRPKKGK